MKRNLVFFLFFVTLYPSFGQDDRTLIRKIDSLNTVGINFYDKNDIKQSIDVFSLAIKLSDSIDDSYGKAIANLTLGNIYSKMNEDEDAERCFTKTLNASLKINDNYLLAQSYLNLGSIYSEGYGDKEKSVEYFKRALIHAKEVGVNDQQNTYDRLSVTSGILIKLSASYLDLENSQEAHTYLLRAHEVLELLQKNPITESRVAFLFGRYYALKGLNYNSIVSYKNAINIAKTGSENSNESNLIISEIYNEYANSLWELGKKDDAFVALLKHNEYREKVINEERIKQSQIAKASFDIEEYKRDAQQANNETILQSQLTKKIQNINTIVIVSALVLLISLIMLHRNFKSKQRLSAILEARNEQLEIAKNEAIKSSELKSNFISNVSHELRTPLYGVVGLTSLLLKNNDLSERDNKFLKSLKFSGDYLLNLINDVLQIGKIESNTVETHNTSINVKGLVTKIADSFEYQLETNSNTFHLHVDDDVPNYVFGDNIRLTQVLINLLGNSLKFTNNGNIWLNLKAIKTTKEDAIIRFEIIDDGPGIAQEKQKLIFENFSQLERKHNNDYQGTGLGLSIVKNLIEILGSDIKLISEEGKGSTFSFDLALKVDKENNRKVESDLMSFQLNREINFKILIVEDNKINQIVTQNILEKENFTCDIVENGELAVAAVMKNTYDLVLMDLNMPIMNGVDATVKIRTFDSDIPIVALTASNLEEVEDKIKNHGFNDIIIKPYDNYEFYQTIAKNLENSRKLNRLSVV